MRILIEDILTVIEKEDNYVVQETSIYIEDDKIVGIGA